MVNFIKGLLVNILVQVFISFIEDDAIGQILDGITPTVEQYFGDDGLAVIEQIRVATRPAEDDGPGSG